MEDKGTSTEINGLGCMKEEWKRDGKVCFWGYRKLQCQPAEEPRTDIALGLGLCGTVYWKPVILAFRAALVRKYANGLQSTYPDKKGTSILACLTRDPMLVSLNRPMGQIWPVICFLYDPYIIDFTFKFFLIRRILYSMWRLHKVHTCVHKVLWEHSHAPSFTYHQRLPPHSTISSFHQSSPGGLKHLPPLALYRKSSPMPSSELRFSKFSVNFFINKRLNLDV